MAMPEAAMDKNCRLMPWQYDVGLPWKVLPMKAEAKSQGMQGATQGELGARVDGSDPRHPFRSLSGGKSINQTFAL
jgi:hypothetical protein